MPKANRKTLVVAAQALLLLFTLPVQAKPTKTIAVDCSKGESINKALKDSADELIVEISGLCDEVVNIRRSYVTLRGADPHLDGVVTYKRIPAVIAVVVLTAANVTFENLRLTGYNSGLAVDLAFGVTCRNCRLEGSGYAGVVVAAGRLLMEDTVVTGNASRGIVVENGGHLTCHRCSLAGNGPEGLGRAVQVQEGSEAWLFDSTVAGNPAIFARGGGNLWVFGSASAEGLTSRIEAVPDSSGFGSALRVVQNSSVSIRETRIVGPLSLGQMSFVSVDGGQQTLEAFANANSVHEGSMLTVLSEAGLAGDLYLSDFSKAVFHQGTSLAGSLFCASASDAFCEAPVASIQGTSNCDRCLRP